MHITNFETYEEALPNLTNWYDAAQMCADLGNNWRLPTIEELNQIFENKKLGNFGCWSSTLSDDNSLLVWSKGFETGNVYLNPKTNLNRVIPVRNLQVDKSYWEHGLKWPLCPSDDDVETYKNNMIIDGTTLLLGCTKKLISISNRQLDLDPWYKSNSVIVGDWTKNNHFYTNILIDGGLCFTKELCDSILKMASKNCKRFISRSFTHKLDTMRVADYFPSYDDFEIKPKLEIKKENYNFYIWEF